MGDVERPPVALERPAGESLHRVGVEAVARLVVEPAADGRDRPGEAEAPPAAFPLAARVAGADAPAGDGGLAAAVRHPDPDEVHRLAGDGRREGSERVADPAGARARADHRVAAILQAADRNVPRVQPRPVAERELGGAGVEVTLGRYFGAGGVSGHTQ